MKGHMPSRVMKNEALSPLEKNCPCPFSIAKDFSSSFQFNEHINLRFIAYTKKGSKYTLGSSVVNDKWADGIEN